MAAFNAAQPFGVVRLRRIAGPAFEAIYRERRARSRPALVRPDVLVASGSRAVMLAAARGAGRRFRSSRWATEPSSEAAVGMSRGVRLGLSPLRRDRVGVASSRGPRCFWLGVVHPESRVIPNGADPARFRVLPRSRDGVRAKAEHGLPEGPSSRHGRQCHGQKGSGRRRSRPAGIRKTVPDVALRDRRHAHARGRDPKARPAEIGVSRPGSSARRGSTKRGSSGFSTRPTSSS